MDGTEITLPALKEGKDSTEWRLTKGLMVAGVILAISSSLGKVPFTPDQLSAYLANLLAEATKWTKVFLPYATAIYGWYLHKRSQLKSEHLQIQKEVALKSLEVKNG